MGVISRDSDDYPDVNLVIYAYASTSAYQERAATWWTGCLHGTEPIGLPWVVIMGFTRLWTNPKIFSNPMPVGKAIGHVESWLDRRLVRLVHPGPNHANLFFDFLRREGNGGNLTTDAHIAALAIENRATLHTSDTDFLRFEGLRWVNPIA